MDAKVVKLHCPVQKYQWGKIGDDSTVATLAKTQDGFEFNKDAPYAELWMGTHPKGPAVIAGMNETKYLGDWIKENPSVLGEKVQEKFGHGLPYLFKVLSVNKALSIQAHPTKEHSSLLHKSKPELYPDPNHKPEMAIALTPFEALCGFRPVSEILNYFHEVEELLSVVGQEAVDVLLNAEMATEKSVKHGAVQKALKGCLSRLMKCDSEEIKTQLTKLVNRLNDCHEKKEDTTLYLGRLFLRVHSQFPGDVGCFVIYFLNHIHLKPYESIFLGPNVPHAYLSGDIIECMASSDNVVRAGLTPKYKDVDTLLEMLEYIPQTVEETKFTPVVDSGDLNISTYNPPVDDFIVRKVEVKSNLPEEYILKSINGPSILLTMSGISDVTCKEGVSIRLEKGTILFVGCGESLKFTNISSHEPLLLFQAYCE